MKAFHLSLDELYEEGFLYSRHDLGGMGHHLIIDAKDLTQFLDEYAADFRTRVEGLLEKCTWDGEDYEWIVEKGE